MDVSLSDLEQILAVLDHIAAWDIYIMSCDVAQYRDDVKANLRALVMNAALKDVKLPT